MTHIANYVSIVAKRTGAAEWKFGGPGVGYFLRFSSTSTGGTALIVNLPNFVKADDLLQLEEDISTHIQSTRAYQTKWGI